MKYVLEESHRDQKRIKAEREKAKKLKKTQWWLDQLNKGVCYYCQKQVSRVDLTMDHIVPLARGGTSSKGNLVAACKSCNATKKLDTPVDLILEKLAAEKSED